MAAGPAAMLRSSNLRCQPISGGREGSLSAVQ